MSHLFRSVSFILKIQWKQHRVKLILWLLGIVTVTLAVAYAYPSIYENSSDLYGLGFTMQNPAMIAMLGPVADPENYSVAIAFSTEMLLFTAIAMAVMNILLVSSMTRMDEEEGRVELIQSLPIHRSSYSLATTIIVFLLNALILISMGIGLGAINDSAFTWEGAFLYGTIQAMTGLFFAGITFVSAQLNESSRGSRSMAFLILLVAYIIRALGDVNNETLALLSPLGWIVRTEVFLENKWWPIIPLGIGFVLFLVIGLALNQRRDLFQGYLPQIPGPKKASIFLKTIPGFIWNQSKISLISWNIGIFLIAAVFGAILGDLEYYFSDMNFLLAFLPSAGVSNLTEEFVALLLRIMSLLAVMPSVSILLSLKQDEATSRIDHAYSRPVSRSKMLLSYYLVAVLTIIVVQILLALGLYLTSTQSMEEPIAFQNILNASLLFIPANVFIVSLVTLIIAWKPSWSLGIWLYIIFAFIVMYLGPLFDFPTLVNQLSIYYHVPPSFEWQPSLIISGIALLLLLFSIFTYNKRDINA